MSALAVSQIEKHFITNEIYKRSKRYFDVIKLKTIQYLDSKFRRAPSQTQKESLQKNFENSFMNSQIHFTKKRFQEIQKCKKKHSTYDIADEHDEIQTTQTTTEKNTSSNKKSFDMSKSLPRQFYQNLHLHSSASIKDPFNNFTTSDFVKSDKRKSIDFAKILGRKDFTQKETNFSKTKKIQFNLNPEIQKSPFSQHKNEMKQFNVNRTYEKFYFNNSKFKCLIDVQKERKADQRRFVRTSLFNYQQKQVPLEKIQKGLSVSQKRQNPYSLVFYNGNGKQQPSQMHFRTLKKGQNYWNEPLRLVRKLDFETVKRRQQMIERRLKEIKQRRTVIDQRGELCDAKYFFRNKLK